MISDRAALSQPVTVIVTREVRAGREGEYETWLHGFQLAMREFPGYLGVQTIRPSGEEREYVSVFRFASVAELRAWDRSAERREWLSRLPSDVSVRDADIREHLGLELWVSPGAGEPDRWRTAMLVVVCVYLLVLGVTPVTDWALAFLPPLVRLFASVFVQVLILTYVVMPQLVRWLRPWLFRERTAPHHGDR